MSQNAFSILYTDFFTPQGKRLLSVVSSKMRSLRSAKQPFYVKTRWTEFSRGGVIPLLERFTKFFSPIQGSDIIFLALFLRVMRPVIATLAMRTGEFALWFLWGWDIYTAIILTLGLALYFTRRFLQLRSPKPQS